MSSISLSMIVKNEEKHLARCLSSVKDVVDEMVIVDTGSTDKTIEIAESLGAKVFHFDWIDDFAAARNYSLSKCTGNWILYLDADEELNSSSVDELLSYKIHKPAGVYCTVKSLGVSNLNDSVMKYPRLFANFPGIEFTGKVHEQIIYSLQQNKIPIVDSEIEIIHYGYAIDEEGLKQKKERNLSLLIANEKSGNIYNSLKLIHTLISLNKLDEAEQRVNEIIKNKSLSINDLSMALFYKAQIKLEKNDLKSALEFALKSFKQYKNKPELSYLIYIIYLRTENFNEALKYILHTIETNKTLLGGKVKSDNENILDQTELYLRAINLYLKLNKKNEIEKLLTDFADYISKEQNSLSYNSVYNFLEQFLLLCNCSETNAELLKKIFKKNHLKIILEIIASNYDEALRLRVISVLLKAFPDAAVLYKSLAFSFMENNADAAIDLFKTSLELEIDPTVYIHLIMLYISKNDIEHIKVFFSLLETQFSDNTAIKPQIDLLKSKLSSLGILTEYSHNHTKIVH